MFLTLEDPRAKIKGSRDPLGLQPIWAGFGRHLVCNLTTVTTSVRQFTTLMIGRWIAQGLVERGRIGEDGVLGVFLRFEQFAAYARHVVHGVDDDIRGIERVKRNVAESKRVKIQDDAGGMILSDQRVYGLWGLYSVSARVSGLLSTDSVGVTALAENSLEAKVKPALRPVFNEFERLLLRGGEIVWNKDAKVKALAAVLAPELDSQERQFYGRSLRDAGAVSDAALLKSANRQARFAQCLRKEGALEDEVGRRELVAIHAAVRTIDEDLALPIERILVLEPLLAIAEEIFRLLQARSGQTISALAGELSDLWGGRLVHMDSRAFFGLQAEIEGYAGSESAGFALKVHLALTDGAYESALETLVRWNAHVMALRSGAPWIRIEKGGRLDCRFRAVERTLPSADEMPTLWRNSYFINSLKSISRQVEEPA